MWEGGGSAERETDPPQSLPADLPADLPSFGHCISYRCPSLRALAQRGPASEATLPQVRAGLQRLQEKHNSAVSTQRHLSLLDIATCVLPASRTGTGAQHAAEFVQVDLEMLGAPSPVRREQLTHQLPHQRQHIASHIECPALLRMSRRLPARAARTPGRLTTGCRRSSFAPVCIIRPSQARGWLASATRCFCIPEMVPELVSVIVQHVVLACRLCRMLTSVRCSCSRDCTVFVCVCVCVCVYIQAYIQSWIQSWIHEYLHPSSIDPSIHEYIHTHTHTKMHKLVFVFMHA